MERKYSSFPSPTMPPELISGLAAEGKVNERYSRLSQSHCITIGTRLSHLGIRSKVPVTRGTVSESGGKMAAAERVSDIVHYLIMNRLEFEIIRLPGCAGRKTDD